MDILLLRSADPDFSDENGYIGCGPVSVFLTVGLIVCFYENSQSNFKLLHLISLT